MSDLRKSVLNSQQRNRWTETSQSSRVSTSHAFGSKSSGGSIRYISVPGTPSPGQSSKIERKLHEFLLNFKCGGVHINDGVQRILKIVKKYGPNNNHQQHVGRSSSNSSSATHTQPQQHLKPKSTPKTVTSKMVHQKSKTQRNKTLLEKELERLSDSNGFVATPPRRSKRKPKPVVLFDPLQYECKRKLRSSSRSNVDSVQTTIAKKVQHTKTTRVVNVSPNIATDMEHVTQSSRTSSSFGIVILFFF